jgi:hypothetical protein
MPQGLDDDLALRPEFLNLALKIRIINCRGINPCWHGSSSLAAQSGQKLEVRAKSNRWSRKTENLANVIVAPASGDFAPLSGDKCGKDNSRVILISTELSQIDVKRERWIPAL